MSDPINLDEFCREIEERRQALGMTEQDDWDMARAKVSCGGALPRRNAIYA